MYCVTIGVFARKTVLSTLNVTVFAVTADVIPEAPTNPRVSVSRLIASVPVSPEILSVLEIAAVLILVITPFAPTRMIGMAVVDPYEFGVIPKFLNPPISKALTPSGVPINRLLDV